MTDSQKELIVKLGQLAKFKQLLPYYTKPAAGIPATDLAEAVQTSLGKADTALQSGDLTTLNQKVAALESLISEGDNPTAAIDKFNEIVAFLAGITNTDTLDGILSGINDAIAAKYTKPSTGIPATDMAQTVQDSLGLADSAYQKPSTGIPATDLAQGVQDSLALADSALQSGDIAGKADKVASPTAGNFAGLDANGNLTDSGSKAADFKTKQTAVADPTTSGSAIEFIDSFAQNANGDVTVTKKTLQAASASQAGSMSAAHYAKVEAIAYAADSDIEAIFE